MKIAEAKNEINLTLPKFTCDHPLGKHIPKPLPSQHHFMTFVGAPGAGKTSLFLGLLTSKGESRVYRGVYDHLFVFMPDRRVLQVFRVCWG